MCIHAPPPSPAPARRLWAQQGVACRACSVATPKKGCAATSRSPHTAADRTSACAQLSNMRMCKCSTATTGANQQNMGVAGPRLQGLYGRPKRGVRPNEPLIAHSSAADERLRKAIKHNVLAPARTGKQVPARKILAPLLEDPRVIHPNNVRELDRWSKLVVIASTTTIPLPSHTGTMHMHTLTVLEPGRKRKTDNPQEWARQIRSYNCHQVHIHLLTHPIRCHTNTHTTPALIP